MKFGQTFYADSLPQWRVYNIDYNELKQKIKANTSKDSGQAIVIPGQPDTTLAKFESHFFAELTSQHERAGLFVRSKSDEINRRLDHWHKYLLKLLTRCERESGRMTFKRWNKFEKCEREIMSCGKDIEALQRFVALQRMAFHKILKKYSKWTGSRALSERFNNEVLGNSKSFVKLDLQPLESHYQSLLDDYKISTPIASGQNTPPTPSRRHSYQKPKPSSIQTRGWNEYDDGSEAGDAPEAYTILANPEGESTFPGSDTITSVVQKIWAPLERIGWVKQKGKGSRRERQSLLDDEERASSSPSGSENGTYTSSEGYAGYITHYSTFPSVNDQRIMRHKENLLFIYMLISFAASFVLLMISTILVATGKHRLLIEVDAGVITGTVSSLFFAALAVGTMMHRKDTLSTWHRGAVAATFALLCLANGVLLVKIAERIL